MSTGTTRAPERSHEQRIQAIRKANVVRMSRATLKRQIHSTADAARVVLDPPSCASTMKVYDLLMAVRGWGVSRVNMALRMTGVSAVKTLGALSPRQRGELVRVLGCDVGAGVRPIRGSSDG